jgi:hypothetical protein
MRPALERPLVPSIEGGRGEGENKTPLSHLEGKYNLVSFEEACMFNHKYKSFCVYGHMSEYMVAYD